MAGAHEIRGRNGKRLYINADGSVPVSNNSGPLNVYLSHHRSIQWAGQFCSERFVGQVSADASTGGKVWLLNNVGSSVLVQVRQVIVSSAMPDADVNTDCRITSERITFTGTPSGTLGTAGSFDTNQSLSSSVSIRLANTGMTITPDTIVGASWLGERQASGMFNGRPGDVSISEDRDEGVVLRAGEGLVFRQADAGDVNIGYMILVRFDVFTQI